MRIAGHSNITMSMRYVHPTDDTIHKAFAALTGERESVGGHKTGNNQGMGALQKEMEIVGNPHEYSTEMVSAAGLEPATHALKEYPAPLAGICINAQEWRYAQGFSTINC